jgi:oligopeptide transport system substrate-binding protein
MKSYQMILILSMICIFCSCKKKFQDQPGKTVFRYNEASNITSLDPAFAKDLANIWPCNQLFNGLVQLDDELQIKPCIARSWDVSPDSKVYTFHLRPDVFFHDHFLFPGNKGRKVVASDFVYSFNRIADPSTASPGAWVFKDVQNINGKYSFFSLDDSTLQIDLIKPNPPFLGILTMQYCSVVPREIVEKLGPEFRRNPAGTGPFRFSMWQEGIKLVLVKNDNYFEFQEGTRLPFLDAVSITFLIDKQSAFLEFVKGNLDFMSGIDASYKDELLTKSGKLKEKYQDRFDMITQPYLNTEYLGFMMDTSLDFVKSSPLRKKEVRQAINYGFDRVKMIRYLRNNIGTPGNSGIIPVGMPGYDTTDRGYDYDPDRARKLLEKSGFPNGSGMPEITLHTTADYVDICKYLQHQLQDIGIPMSIEVNPSATLREMKAQAKLDFFRASWIADYPDEESYLSLFISKNFTPDGPNYTRFSNAEFDRLYDLSQAEVNDSVRKSYYRQMNRIIIEEAPVIILYYDQVLRFVQKNITGTGSNPLNLLSLKSVRKINRK